MDPGSQRGRLTIDYPALRADFVIFLESKKVNARYFSCMLSYLDKYVDVVNGPMDLVKVFSGLTAGQQHNLNRGVRNLFNFLEDQGFDRDYLDLLRRNIPKEQVGFDLKIPQPEQIVESLHSVLEAHPKYCALYNLLLDSGLRVTEGCRLINTLAESKVEKFGDFYVADLGYFRGTKLAYFAFFTEHTYNLLTRVTERLEAENASHYMQKMVPGAVAFKYLRKFANDTMTNEELNIPESTADFIQGRTPKTVAARHYMKLKRKAVQFYPRYATYVEKLRQKALN